MPILHRPYRRIFHPFKDLFCNGSFEDNFIIDHRNAPNINEENRAIYSIYADFIRITEFVEPADENLCCYSNRIFDLFMRASMEFEAQCKAILNANHYNPRSHRHTILDYCEIENAAQLSNYRIFFSSWKGGEKTIAPFQWGTGEHEAKLKWYKDYNESKHNKYSNMGKANLSNLIHSIAALFSIRYAQFGFLGFDKFNDNNQTRESDEALKIPGTTLFLSRTTDLFQYDFDWAHLKDEEDPYTDFLF